MTLIITPAYAGLLALLYLVLAGRVLAARRASGITLGDGGDARLIRAMRVQANFAEYVPLALLLIAFVEQQRYPALLVHGLGLTLLAARVSHAFGMGGGGDVLPLRAAGILLTLVVVLAGALLVLASVLALRPAAV